MTELNVGFMIVWLHLNIVEEQSIFCKKIRLRCKSAINYNSISAVLL